MKTKAAPPTPDGFNFMKLGFGFSLFVLAASALGYAPDSNHLFPRTCAALTNLPSAARLKLDFTYDYRSRRITKKVSTWTGSAYVAASTNKFLYDGWNLIAILNPPSSIVQSFTWGLDLSGTGHGAGGVGGLLWVFDSSSLSNQPSTHFAAFDGNGNLETLLNAADATVSANYRYSPYGTLLRATGPMAEANPVRFSTKYHDDETDLIYFGQRYFDPRLGRWTSRDPIEEEGGLNVYAFVGNAPVNAVDLLGREGFWSTFGSGVAHDTVGVGKRFVYEVSEGIYLTADSASFLAAQAWGYGDAFEGSSRTFQYYGANATKYNPAELRWKLLGKTGYDVVNVGLVGLPELAQGWYEGVTTGNYERAQDAQLNSALLLTAFTGKNPRPYSVYPSADVVAAWTRLRQWTGQQVAKCRSAAINNEAHNAARFAQYIEQLRALEAAQAAKGIPNAGGLRSLMSADEAARYDGYWASLGDRAPVQSIPFNIIRKYDANGGLRGAMTYDQYGNRAYQYEFGPTIRHGEGYHIYDNSASGSFGDRPRSGHIPY